MPKKNQFLVVFSVSLGITILCKIYYPPAMLIPAVGFGLYISYYFMPSEKIEKIVAFIMGKSS